MDVEGDILGLFGMFTDCLDAQSILKSLPFFISRGLDP